MEDIALTDWRTALEVFREPLFHVGDTPVSLAMMLQFVILLIVIGVVSRLSRRVLRRQLRRWTRFDSGLQESISRAGGHIVLLVGFLMALQVLGFDLTSLAVVAGALGLGLGFGLQNIVNNFVSGLIILAERPIQIGDRVVVGDTEADVVRIGARSTSIRTNDNIVIIVPNSEFISSRVVNLSHGDPKIRIRVPFGVSYGSDVRLVERVSLEVARAHPSAMKKPPPTLRFVGFGDSSLDFELMVWTIECAHRPGIFRSEIYFSLWDAFEEHDIEIPFPQRDLHVKGPLRIDSPPGGEAGERIRPTS